MAGYMDLFNEGNTCTDSYYCGSSRVDLQYMITGSRGHLSEEGLRMVCSKVHRIFVEGVRDSEEPKDIHQNLGLKIIT